jgi:hypothetical protein
MNAVELRKQLDIIAQNEYQKIVTITGSVRAFSILNTNLLGIDYWNGDDGSGYSFCYLKFTVSSHTSKRSYCFDTMEQVENFLKKDKSKGFLNPFDCFITKEYFTVGSTNEIEDSIFDRIEKPILLKKTTIMKR